MRILVTGGAGYIGSHVCRVLVRAGHDVLVVDDLHNGHRAAIAGNVTHAGLDDHLRPLLCLERIGAVVHLAAHAIVSDSVLWPRAYAHHNIVGSYELLEAMLDLGVSRILFASSAAVYGDSRPGAISERQRHQPASPYGFTKSVVERMLADYANAYGMAYGVLRIFNAAGASPDGDIGEDHRPETHLIPLALRVALEEKGEVAIFGDDHATPDGTCIRDYVHVDDIAASVLLGLDHLTPGEGWAVNIGSGQGFSVREVVAACRWVTGWPIPTVVHPRRPGDPSQLVADRTLAKELLGWQPAYTSLESIVRTAVKWHRAHPRGYDDAV